MQKFVCERCNALKPAREFNPYRLEDVLVRPDTCAACVRLADRARRGLPEMLVMRLWELQHGESARRAKRKGSAWVPDQLL